jgi:hypothetical protein
LEVLSLLTLMRISRKVGTDPRCAVERGVVEPDMDMERGELGFGNDLGDVGFGLNDRGEDGFEFAMERGDDGFGTD